MFKDKFNEYKQLFEIEFNKKINDLTYIDKTLEKAVKYSLTAGGKRIRPVLMLMVSDVLGVDKKEVMPFAIAVEFIHTYSLIHDDLPSMDNDDMRRGKPSCHKAFGEATALLAGDTLLTEAFFVASNANVSIDKRLNAVSYLSSNAGLHGMIGGQVLDIAAESKAISAENLLVLHQKKTGALIKASAALGAISAGRDSNLFSDYASSLGLAFQIRDDILDVEGDVETFGKPIMSDEKNNKTTYVSLFGIDGAKKKLCEETDKAIASIEFLGEKGRFLKELALYLLERKN